MHFRGVIWKIKSKSNFPVSLSLISAEMNLVGNYRMLRGLRTVNPEGLPSAMCGCLLIRLRPNWITGPWPKSGSARKSESHGPEIGVSRWRQPNLDICSQNDHFGLVYDMIYQFLGIEAKNYKFGMFYQQCHPSMAPGDADIRPTNASWIHTCHLFMW